MKSIAQLAIVCGLMVLSGCKKTRVRSDLHTAPYRQELNEAKLVDVSVPVGVIAYDMTMQDDSVERGSETIAFYETDFSDTMLREFYQMDMERLGWKEVQTFISNEESLLLYETPRKIAAISIRPYATVRRGVVIFVSPRYG